MKNPLVRPFRQGLALVAALALATLSGCATHESGSARHFFSFNSNARHEDNWLTTRVSLAHSCIINDHGKDGGGFLGILAALGPIILPKLIDFGLSAVSTGVRNIASMTRTNVVARTNGQFLRGDTSSGLYRAHENLGCVVFAYGRMTDTGSMADGLSDPWEINREAFQQRGFNFAEEPLFYFEGIVNFADDGTGSFSINTAYLHVSEELGRTRFFGNDEDALLTFTFQRQEGDVIAVGAIPFADLNRAITVSGDELDAYSTSWLPLPQPSEYDQVRFARFCEQNGCPAPMAASTQGGADTAALPACGDPTAICAQPYTLVVEFSRSSNVGAALNEFADQLDYARPAIAPHLEQELSQEAQARLNLPTPATDAQITAAHAACEALVESRTSYQAATAEARVAMSADVRAKIAAAQTAYQNAGINWWNVLADSALGCVLTRTAG